MDLHNFKNSWQEQKIDLISESETLDKVMVFNKKVEKENLSLSIIFASTIFILGFAVLPILKSTTSMLLVSSLFFLMGFQALAFWMRNISVQRSISEAPRTFVGHLIKKLKYNLIVTKIIIPIYLLILGIIFSFYIYDLLSGFDVNGLYILMITGLCWSFLIGIFLYSWPKQRAKDETIIVPMIEELEEIRNAY